MLAVVVLEITLTLYDLSFVSYMPMSLRTLPTDVRLGVVQPGLFPTLSCRVPRQVHLRSSPRGALAGPALLCPAAPTYPRLRQRVSLRWHRQ